MNMTICITVALGSMFMLMNTTMSITMTMLAWKCSWACPRGLPWPWPATLPWPWPAELPWPWPAVLPWPWPAALPWPWPAALPWPSPAALPWPWPAALPWPWPAALPWPWPVATGSGGGQPACPRLVVNGADYADCNGEYELSTERVDWAPQRFVYRHVAKDRWGISRYSPSGKRTFFITFRCVY